MLETFTPDMFTGRRGQRFRVVVDDSTAFDAELIEVASGSDPGGAGRRVPFSLVFRAPLEHLHPQRIYRIEHAELGVLALFLVPIGPDESGMRYEAVFG